VCTADEGCCSDETLADWTATGVGAGVGMDADVEADAGREGVKGTVWKVAAVSMNFERSSWKDGNSHLRVTRMGKYLSPT